MSTPSFQILETTLKNRPLLVEASAGTGKTFALTGLVVRLVLEGVRLPEILVVTFTVAATEELKTRIRTALREAAATFRADAPASDAPFADFREKYVADSRTRHLYAGRLERAILDIDEASVFTIHGFCTRILEQAAFESGAPLTMQMVDEAPELLERAIADFWQRHAYANAWFASLALREDLEALQNHYKRAHRYPNTRLVPDVMPLSETLNAIGASLANIASSLEHNLAEATQYLNETEFNQSSPLANEEKRGETIDRLLDRIHSAPHSCVAAIEKLSSEAVFKGANKVGNAKKERAALARRIPLFVACQHLCDVLEETRRSLTYAYISEVYARFQELKREAGITTFDDLLRMVHDALAPEAPTREPLLAAIGRRWTHALIDEFQDTDPLQYEIFRTAFAGKTLVFVGDPKQAIYAFRGADLYAYLQAKRDTEQAATTDDPTRYMLDTNWRSAKHLVEAVNVLFTRPGRPFIHTGIPYERVYAAGRADDKPLSGDGRKPLVWWTVSAAEDESTSKDAIGDRVLAGTVAGIKQLLASGAKIGEDPIAPRHLAILVRINRQAEEFQKLLRAEGIPAVISKSGDIWKSAEVRDLEWLLRAFLRPADRSAVCTALATDLVGRSASEIHAFRQDEDEQARMREQLRDYGDLWRKSGILAAVSAFAEEHGVTGKLLAYADGERRLTNLRHALELLHDAERRQRRGPDELLQWIRSREDRKPEDRETAELRLETDAEAVQIVTIHKSKGLQYEVVFAPFLWDGRQEKKNSCPLVHEDGDVIYDLGSEQATERRSAEQAEELAENLRVTYVALTRARHRCYVVWAEANLAERSPLAYLLLGHEAGGESMAEHVVSAISEAKGLMEKSRERLEEWAARHPDLMEVEELPTDGPVVHRPAAPEIELRPRTVPEEARPRLSAWRVTSYSQLTRREDGADEPTSYSASSATSAGKDELKGMFAFAAGRLAGSCLHEIIEEVDLSACVGLDDGREVPAAVRTLVERKLKAFGLDNPRRHRNPSIDPYRTVIAMLGRLARTPMPLAGCRLADLDPARALKEWAFVVPVEEINQHRLAEAFAAHGSTRRREEYANRLRRMDISAIDGYLTGIADFAFEHEGRWFVFDWKSTMAGDHPDDYTAERLEASAFEHDYDLQLAIYALGMHRYLRTRIPDYDFDRHFGGAGVVFLRAVDGETDRGFYLVRPSRDLVEALDAALLTPVTI
jgi:exodeoxyribonuclease V beta subunit